MDDFKVDARRWRFLNHPEKYIERQSCGLQLEPLKRQFRTAKEILSRLADGRGVLLADDVGLGKTTVAALVAWAIACQNKRVRIYAPNDVLRRRWAEELAKHVPLLHQQGASLDRIKQGDTAKLTAGRIQVATHHSLVRSHANSELRTACDLMIVDEAHRAKGEGSAFNEALRNLGGHAKRKLILTATPFGIRLSELEQLLRFVGARSFDGIRRYSAAMKRLYELGEGNDIAAECSRLVNAAHAAIAELEPFVIRHGVDHIASERKHFGEVDPDPWQVAVPKATQDDVSLMLRMDRILGMTAERSGERRNDPRFHVGWQHFESALERATERARAEDSQLALKHIRAASSALKGRRLHPKVAAVAHAIKPLVESGEKVLVFCHHRATAGELLVALERLLKADMTPSRGPAESVWRAAWEQILVPGDELIGPIIDWLCTPGLRQQVAGWLSAPASTASALARQLETTRVRNAVAPAPTIAVAARALAQSLVDHQSTSTRAVLKSISRGDDVFGGRRAHFPGRLDEGLRTMGSWDLDGQGRTPRTLYTGKPDIVLAVFNSPFGPDLLVATDRLSEGVDLHRFCRHLIHYELDPSPIRTIQRNGRIRRVGSWASVTRQPVRYAYPTFGGTRDEKAVEVMKQRVNAFGLLLGGVPSLDDSVEDGDSFARAVMAMAQRELQSQNRRLCVPKRRR